MIDTDPKSVTCGPRYRISGVSRFDRGSHGLVRLRSMPFWQFGFGILGSVLSRNNWWTCLGYISVLFFASKIMCESWTWGQTKELTCNLPYNGKMHRSTIDNCIYIFFQSTIAPKEHEHRSLLCDICRNSVVPMVIRRQVLSFHVHFPE